MGIMANSLLTDASRRLDRALKYVSISEDAAERLKAPKASLKVSDYQGDEVRMEGELG